MDLSPLQKARYTYQPKLPAILRERIGSIAISRGTATEPATRRPSRLCFPIRADCRL